MVTGDLRASSGVPVHDLSRRSGCCSGTPERDVRTSFNEVRTFIQYQENRKLARGPNFDVFFRFRFPDMKGSVSTDPNNELEATVEL